MKVIYRVVGVVLLLTALAGCEGANLRRIVDAEVIAVNGSTHSVTYNANGAGVTGTPPVDSTNYTQGQTVTVLGNTGNLQKPGYSFIGWNTQADGNGTTYTQGQTFAMGSANITLYARWTNLPTYTVTYNANGAGVTGTPPVDSTNYTQGQTVTVLGNAGNLARTGYSFSGWNTQADGNGTTYTQGQTFTMGSTNIILYAKWTSLSTYALTVSAGSGGSTTPSGTISVYQGVATPIAATPSTNYAFAGWAVTSGTGVSFADANAASTTVTLANGAATIQASFGYAFTWTDQTLAGSREWWSIASSIDGTKLAACVGYPGGDIWTSGDSGVHWTDQTLSGSTQWGCIASSSDGTKLAAGVCGTISGDIWTSTDSGVHWTDRTSAIGAMMWISIASSSDGTKLAACAYGRDIWTSTDSGANWTDRTLAGSRAWASIASSSDGTKLAACAYDGDIWTSTDGGANWTDQNLAGSRKWGGIASSSDGTKLAAIVGVGGDIWTSSDSGVHWTDQTLAGTRDWQSIASSADGTKLAAGGGDIWTSSDSGVHWTDQTSAGYRLWQGFASSSDGAKLATCVRGGDIYTGQ